MQKEPEQRAAANGYGFPKWVETSKGARGGLIDTMQSNLGG